MTVFNSTEQALAYQGDLSEIRELREIAVKWSFRHRAMANRYYGFTMARGFENFKVRADMYWNMGMIAATNAQLYREAIENKEVK